MNRETHIYSVYLVETPDGRAYVGCTSKTPEQRLAGYYRGCPRIDGYAEQVIAYFGRENCSVTHLASAVGAENAAATETALIAQHDTVWPKGMNRARRSNISRRPSARRTTPKVIRDLVWLRVGPCKSWPPQVSAA